MHLRILPDHQNQVLKNYFVHLWSGRKRVLMHFQATRIKSVKKLFFNVWNGQKGVLMHLRILLDHQNFIFNKNIFDRQEWLKTCFDAFSHTSRPPETPETFFQKRYFLTSGVVKNVFSCICANFQTTRTFLQKRFFWLSGVGLKTCFDAFGHTSRPPVTFFQKRYFLPSGVVKNVFWCICAYFQTTRNFFSKKIFFTVWSG